MRRLFVLVLTVSWIVAVSSCGNVKDIAYFQNRVLDHPEKIDRHAGIVIQPKDMLSIVVSSRNPELAAMFNLPVVSYQAGSEISQTGGYSHGLTRWELAEMIKKKLISGGYLSDAVVTVEFMNFKVSVLGEVTMPGTFNIEGDKVTVLQALALARDLTIYGRRDNVCVIREQDGRRVMYQINLTDVDLFKSPAYFLQQNDVVYVEPNVEKARQSTIDDKGLRITTIAVSSTSVLLSLVSILINVLQ